MRSVSAVAKALVLMFSISELALASNVWASGSGVWPSFVTDARPAPPSDKFAAGNLDLVQPTWDATYLYVVYRYLAGTGFDPAEQKVLLSIWNEPSFPQPDPHPQEDWLAARGQIPDAPPAEPVLAFAPANDLDSYLNCHDDAFRTATTTLESMVTKFGSSSAQVKRWLDAQDLVFQNCPGAKKAPHLPTSLDSGTQFEKAQRAYQIACANFYSENFDAAGKLFVAIGANAASPWHEIAPYLAARATLRKATLSAEKNDSAMLAEAEKQFGAIVAGKSDEGLKTSAQRLLDFVRCRLHPEERHAEVVRALMRPGSEKTLAHDLDDYRHCGTPRKMGDYNVDDFDDWIATFQSKGDVTHAIQKWKQTRSMPWLLASLAVVGGKDPEADTMIDAARHLPHNSPVRMTVDFHIARILTEQGKADEARAMIDAIGVKPPALSRSAYNQFAGIRIKLARNIDEYLKFALLYPVAIESSDSIEYVIEDQPFGPDSFVDPKEMRRLAEGPVFAGDVVGVMNGWVPLSVLNQIARSQTLQPSLRAQVATSVWVRSVLLGNEASARELIPIVGELVPGLKTSLAAWLSAKTKDEQSFDMALMILRNPGMSPYFVSGLGRFAALGRVDPFRDNWWSAHSPLASSDRPTPIATSFAPSSRPTPIAISASLPEDSYPPFLSEAERKSADLEWTRLSSIDGPELLCTEAIRHVRTHRDDERAPEALYRCINAVHLSQATERCNALAESAFHLLHSRYPNTRWARENHFWYRASGSSPSRSVR